ncbi:hypothetical protein GCM10016234_35120 [Tianweitania populi]|uniref:Uncharacterized protein n=1 Tax=Tianweitania populi TaxID=1607949 RepID=A0A8J3DSW2_9HYPH|nr:hypothetical protein GCM10016234_35120 [Tianweitania populi]
MAFHINVGMGRDDGQSIGTIYDDVAIKVLTLSLVELHKPGQGQRVDSRLKTVQGRSIMEKANKELLIVAGFPQGQCPVKQTALDAS